MIKDGVAIGTLQASQLKRFPSEQYKCFMQIRHHPPTHILTGAVVRLNQYVSPHHPRIAYSQLAQLRYGAAKSGERDKTITSGLPNTGDMLNVKENLKKETKFWIVCQNIQNHPL